MRISWACLLLFFAAGGALRAAELPRAPDIPAGTSPEEVIRLYGWPKGKGVAEGGRENWLYPHFQVRLRDGRVVSVDYIAPEPASRRKLPIQSPVPATATSPALPTRSGVSGKTAPAGSALGAIVPAKGGSTAPTAARPRPNSISLQPVHSSSQPSSRLTTETAAAGRRGTNPRDGSFAFFKGFGVVGFVLLSLMASAAVVVGWMRRLKPLPSFAVPPVLSPKDWKSTVAERLERSRQGVFNAGSSAPLRPSPPEWKSGAFSPEPQAGPPESDASGRLTYELLDRLEWRRYEMIVQAYYAATGVKAEFTSSGADGGVDIRLFRPGESLPFSLVQCKAWGPRRVDVATVRELRGVMADASVREAVFATTGQFTADAEEFCRRNAIVPLTGSDFVAKFNALASHARQRILADVTRGDFTTPSCPRCEQKMVWREKPEFWSCPTFRQCRSQPIHPRKRRRD